MQTLKEARLAKGIKAESVADALGVTRQTYAKYEANPGEMSIEQAAKACEFIGAPVDEIFLPMMVSNF